mmetsp:Transcript_27189/g.70464  ORF Transcript_27189/g.70464 Transcript_27189/m.70464 type:complete len:360 (-) Transcript_27189:1107-2186(-)
MYDQARSPVAFECAPKNSASGARTRKFVCSANLGHSVEARGSRKASNTIRILCLPSQTLCPARPNTCSVTERTTISTTQNNIQITLGNSSAIRSAVGSSTKTRNTGVNRVLPGHTSNAALVKIDIRTTAWKIMDHGPRLAISSGSGRRTICLSLYSSTCISRYAQKKANTPVSGKVTENILKNPNIIASSKKSSPVASNPISSDPYGSCARASSSTTTSGVAAAMFCTPRRLQRYWATGTPSSRRFRAAARTIRVPSCSLTSSTAQVANPGGGSHGSGAVGVSTMKGSNWLWMPKPINIPAARPRTMHTKVLRKMRLTATPAATPRAPAGPITSSAHRAATPNCSIHTSCKNPRYNSDA